MKIIATTIKGKKLVATLDENNNIDKMSVNYVSFEGISYRNPELWENYIEIPYSDNVSKSLEDVTPNSRVFTNCSVNISTSYREENFCGEEMEKEADNFIDTLKKNPKVVCNEHFDITKRYSTNYDGIKTIRVSYWVMTGYTSGNGLCELDLSTLTKKTVEVFNTKYPEQRRKINLKQFTFLVVNY